MAGGKGKKGCFWIRFIPNSDLFDCKTAYASARIALFVSTTLLLSSKNNNLLIACAVILRLSKEAIDPTNDPFESWKRSTITRAVGLTIGTQVALGS